jgi:N6-L-threonylcarbamoyladenine synthase
MGLGLDLPVVGVNHIEAHLHAASLEHGESPWPAVALVVSGGHTELVLMRGFGSYRWLGGTRDDAAGEAFDKVAKLLGTRLPGRAGDRRTRAARAAPTRSQFPRPMLDRPGYDFSFSGLKTAVAQCVAGASAPPLDRRLSPPRFQRAVVDTLVEKSRPRAGRDRCGGTHARWRRGVQP